MMGIAHTHKGHAVAFGKRHGGLKAGLDGGEGIAAGGIHHGQRRQGVAHCGHGLHLDLARAGLFHIEGYAGITVGRHAIQLRQQQGIGHAGSGGRIGPGGAEGRQAEFTHLFV